MPNPSGPQLPEPAAGGVPCAHPVDVSILIPVHNRCDLTRECFDSLFAHADPGIRTEILVIDDCSTDETPEYLRGLGSQVRVIRNARRRCFGHNMNHAARLARGKYLCLLNNDTRVTAGWLSAMVAVLERDPAVGVVGNKHLFPSTGKLNHAGMVFDDNGYAWHLYPCLDADLPCANVSREFQAVTAACWLVPRALFLDLGGFEEQFRNGFEDVDFCLRVRQRHRKVYYCAESVIYHHGQSSPGRTDNDKANWECFRKKWAGRIAADMHLYHARDGMLPPPPQQPESAAKSARSAASADVHFAIPLELPVAFCWVTARLAVALEEIGLKVSLKPGGLHPSVDQVLHPQLRAMMDRPPSPRLHVKWHHYWEPFQKEEVYGDINAEVFVTNYRYGPADLNTIDRWMRQVVRNDNRKLPVSGFARDALVELGVPAERCAVVPHGYSPEVLTAEGADDRYRAHGTVFLAITNSHDLYRYGTDILLEAYRQAFDGRDDVVLVLKDYGVGADESLLGRWLRDGKPGPRVIRVTDFLEKDDLVRLYRGADFFVAPFRGEGFGMKILDAFALGLPVLLPEYGGPVDYLMPGTYYPLRHRLVPVGECTDSKYNLLPVCAHWAEVEVQDLARQLREAARDKEGARRRAELARDHVLKEYSWRRAAERLVEGLGRFERERHQVVGARQLSGPPAKKLSVIIPTFNRPDALGKCLAAYREQTLPADQWEMILVDDGSNYPVADLVRAQAAGLPTRLVVNDRNRGPAHARNRGIELSRGDLVLFTGDDIIPDPAFLAEHVRAHDCRPDEKGAVLGYTYWHPEVAVTPLMNYITEEGGQQFYYNFLRPYQAAPYNCFYTSNLSLHRTFLVEQERMFSTQFPYAAYEDVEFAQRLARQGMTLVFHPLARAGHLHALTDAQIFERQYRVGRMMLRFLLLHPEQRPQEYMPLLHWLEVTQQLLLKDPGFRTACTDLARWSEAFPQWLALGSAAAAGLTGALAPDRYDHDGARPLLQQVGSDWLRCRKALYAYQLDLELHAGIADEWAGVKAGEPNPIRDLVRFYLCTGVWKLLDRGVPEYVPPRPAPAARGVLKLARRLRHHPWLVPFWSQVRRLPGVHSLKRATKRMLDLAS